MHLKRKAWEELREPLQARLQALQAAASEARVPVIILLEGWDAAGKGASIQALSEALDPRGFKTWSIRAPRGEEHAYPWLWRFWMKLPARGEVAIFDRGWYSQALTLEPEDERHCALRDIVDLERLLVEDGHVLVKFWLHIDQAVQRQRLKAREKRLDGVRLAKSWAQNRNYAAYAQAAAEMIEKTRAAGLPWITIEAKDPHFTWWQVCEGVAEGLDGGLRSVRNEEAKSGQSGRPASPILSRDA